MRHVPLSTRADRQVALITRHLHAHGNVPVSRHAGLARRGQADRPDPGASSNGNAWSRTRAKVTQARATQRTRATQRNGSSAAQRARTKVASGRRSANCCRLGLCAAANSRVAMSNRPPADTPDPCGAGHRFDCCPCGLRRKIPARRVRQLTRLTGFPVSTSHNCSSTTLHWRTHDGAT